MRGCGFDGASVMSGANTGVAARIRVHSPHCQYMHCRCHCLALASVETARQFPRMLKVFNFFTTLWKFFAFSAPRTHRLEQIQTILNMREYKTLKPSDTRWLANDRACTAIINNLTALVTTTEDLHQTLGDSDALGLAKTMRLPDTVAGVHLLGDVLDILAKLNASLQSKSANLGDFDILVSAARSKLQAIIDSPRETLAYRQWVEVFKEPTHWRR